MIKSAKRFEFAAFDIDDDTYVVGQAESEMAPDAPAELEAQSQQARSGDEPQPEPPPGFSEDDLNAARVQGYDEGYRAGEAAAKQQAAESRQHKLGLLGESIAAQIEALLHAEAERRAAAEADSIAIAHEIAKTILPAYAERYGLHEITKMIERHMAERVEEPRLAIRVADEMLDDVRNWTEPMAQRFGFEGKLVLLADPQLGPQDCLIEWADGGVERRLDATWQNIDESVAEATGAANGKNRDAAPQTTARAPYPNTAHASANQPQNLTSWPDMAATRVRADSAPSIPQDRTEL